MRDFRELSADDLRKKESDLREELFNLRFQKKVGQIENPLKIRSLRKDIARVKTLLNAQRPLQASKAVPEAK
jgi:large subunit ribosomal protein L29